MRCVEEVEEGEGVSGGGRGVGLAGGGCEAAGRDGNGGGGAAKEGVGVAKPCSLWLNGLPFDEFTMC